MARIIYKLLWFKIIWVLFIINLKDSKKLSLYSTKPMKPEAENILKVIVLLKVLRITLKSVEKN
jgi:hypothetical protein